MKEGDAAKGETPAGSVPVHFTKANPGSGVAVMVAAVPDAIHCSAGETEPPEPAETVTLYSIPHCHSRRREAAGVGWT